MELNRWWLSGGTEASLLLHPVGKAKSFDPESLVYATYCCQANISLFATFSQLLLLFHTTYSTECPESTYL